MARILVIEDERDVGFMLKRVLELAGHQVLSAADGAEGMKLFREAPAELVITDLYMPNQEGLETIMQLRREFPDLKVIAISGNEAAGAMLTVARALGAVAALQKPFSSDELLAAVEKAL
jgi:two-component system, chemotaxis family, chemotaxis protein CheY